MSQLPHSADMPFSMPEDGSSKTPADYPQFDSNLDSHEAYDEGLDEMIDDNPYSIDTKIRRTNLG